MPHIIVVGGGLLGTVSALLAARRGWEVTLVEAEPALWTRASRVNEGKIHLGPVFALGGLATAEVMLRGAFSFASTIDEAVGRRMNWAELVTDCFDYVVMPDSLCGADELAERYAGIRATLDALRPQLGRDYLGGDIERVIATTPHTHEASGLCAFRSEERAVDAVALGAIIVNAVETSGIRVLTRTTATRLESSSLAHVHVASHDGTTSVLSGDVVVNAAWEHQQQLLPAEHAVERNYRLKAATIVNGYRAPHPLTLVQGPYGDVVPYADRTYASWYPVGRLSHEHGLAPSDTTMARLRGLADDTELGRAQLAALRGMRLLEADLEPSEVIGGLIIGHGTADIETRASELHTRSEFGARVDDRIITPANFKFTTAPLAAQDAVHTAVRLLASPNPKATAMP
tara:strand:- start:4704 stop:5909 length:1206 start_codon:yes stop_codon:yes gene_type:complete